MDPFSNNLSKNAHKHNHNATKEPEEKEEEPFVKVTSKRNRRKYFPHKLSAQKLPTVEIQDEVFNESLLKQ